MRTQHNHPARSQLRLLAAGTPRPLTPAASAHLDLIRGLAAWAVMWDHLRGLFFVDFQQVNHLSLFLKGIYFFTGFGNEAVLVFFVLSGFLISSVILGRRASGTWSWRDYAIDRACRLYVVLIPGLFLGLLWDRLGSSIFASTGIYSHPLENFAAAVVQTRLGIGTFLGNMFFLQTIVVPTFGSNGPLWSLANEFWYYVLFPVALAGTIVWNQRSIRRAVPLTVLAACVAVFVGWPILLGFPIWLAGTVLVVAYSKCPLLSEGRLGLYVLLSSAVLSACLIVARTNKSFVLGGNLAVGIGFGLFLFGVIHMNFGAGGTGYPRIAHVLAGFSYSLYVLHFPFLLFLRAWMVPAQRWQPDAAHLGLGVVIGAITLGVAWLFSLFTENKTRAARQWMRNVVPALDNGSR
ncbi:MAG TPA: acyltransferase [Candidatus Acidoferrales bacterium]|jgi:peptidoglycan/LPS O-acetylase OafA/YrhL|nr:acyltransferase [Candidatus Acidoferrales bacterium]